MSTLRSRQKYVPTLAPAPSCPVSACSPATQGGFLPHVSSPGPLHPVIEMLPQSGGWLAGHGTDSAAGRAGSDTEEALGDFAETRGNVRRLKLWEEILYQRMKEPLGADRQLRPQRWSCFQILCMGFSSGEGCGGVMQRFQPEPTLLCNLHHHGPPRYSYSACEVG